MVATKQTAAELENSPSSNTTQKSYEILRPRPTRGLETARLLRNTMATKFAKNFSHRHKTPPLMVSESGGLYT